jgi:hypothetical protein
MMKIKQIVLAATMVFAGAQSVHATTQDLSAQAFASELARVYSAVRVLEAGLVAQNLINWKVGEYHKNEVKLSLPFPGSGFKSVTQDVPARNAFWYVNEITILGQKQKTEALMDRSNGATLELIVNGEKQNVENDQELEIIEQYETEVTVPAGKFDCMYIKANVKSQGQKQQLEAWINPIDVNLDGMLKVVVQSQMGPVQLLLKEFGKK